MLRRFIRFGRDQRGQALLMVAAGMSVLVLLTGLTVDSGNLYGHRRQAVNAADAAALAGAYELFHGNGTAAAEAAAYQWAESNGYGPEQVTVNIPPLSGPHAGDSNFVEVLISEDVEKYFIQVAYSGDWSVSARAVAGRTTRPFPYTLLALHPTQCQSILVTGSGNIQVEGGIHGNSSCLANALRKTGSGNIEAGSISLVGGYSIVGSGNVTPEPVTGADVVPDPLADVAPPNLASLPVRSGSLLHITGSTSTTLSPGVYVGGIKISSSGTVTMQPGVYVMRGGGFEYSGSGNVIAEGVLLYNTCSTGDCATGGTSGPIHIAGSGNFVLSAPTSGEYKNIVMFQDRALTTKIDVSGSGNLEGVGTVYAPVAEFEKTGSGNHLMQLIVGSFTYSGSGNLELHYDEDVVFAAPVMRLVE